MALMLRTLEEAPPPTVEAPAKPAVKDQMFLGVKRQLLDEVKALLELRGLTRSVLAQRMNILPTALTQSLYPDKGIQLATIVRIADALECDMEINFIVRGQQAAVAEIVE